MIRWFHFTLSYIIRTFSLVSRLNGARAHFQLLFSYFSSLTSIFFRIFLAFCFYVKVPNPNKQRRRGSSSFPIPSSLSIFIIFCCLHNWHLHNFFLAWFVLGSRFRSLSFSVTMKYEFQLSIFVVVSHIFFHQFQLAFGSIFLFFLFLCVFSLYKTS